MQGGCLWLPVPAEAYSGEEEEHESCEGEEQQHGVEVDKLRAVKEIVPGQLALLLPCPGLS